MLIAIAVTGVDIKTDVSTLTRHESGSDEPDAPEVTRDVLVAIRADDVGQRNDFARKLADMLQEDARVESVNHGPEAPSEAFMNWIWENRFQIAPPGPEAFKTTQMIAQLEDSKAAFSSVEGVGLGDRLLLDPTGSFEYSVLKLAQAADALPTIDGVWQSKYGQTAIVFFTLADQNFDARSTNELVSDIRTFADSEAVSTLLVGGRVVAAEVTLANTSASMFASLIATTLLAGWLIWSLRSRIVITVFIPLAVGVATAVFVVQAVFGSVHVIALGFGGALIGLALDYPIHIIGHPGAGRPRAYRLVIIGAATTSVSFLAMLGSRIPALEQIGVFVASGLVVAAGVAIILPSSTKLKIRIFSLDRFVWHLPFKPWVESALLIGGLAFTLTFNNPAPLVLFEPPMHIKASIQEMGRFIDLPSGRHAIVVSGDSLNDLLEREEELALILDQAIIDGELVAYNMLHQLMTSSQLSLPTPAVFREMAENALSGAGMNVGFANRQVEAYTLALKAPPIRYEELLKFPETRGLALRLKQSRAGWQETVQLYLPKGVALPEFSVTSQGSELIDLVAPVRRNLLTIQNQMIRWLSIGFCLGAVLLFLGLRSWQRTWHIVLTISATTAVTASVLVALFGGLNIFHIVGLALVVGIGVDYSIFFGENSGDSQGRAAGRSIALCASSTFLTFIVLCFSDVPILQHIGITVIVGLTVLLALTLAKKEGSKES